MKKPEITGTTYVRHTSRRAADGRNIVMLISVVAVPDDLLDTFRNESQYTIYSNAGQDFSKGLYPIAVFNKDEDYNSPKRKDANGLLIDCPIWRV